MVVALGSWGGGCVAVGVRVGVWVAVGVRVGVDVAVGVLVGVCVVVGVRVGVWVAVDDGTTAVGDSVPGGGAGRVALGSVPQISIPFLYRVIWLHAVGTDLAGS